MGTLAGVLAAPWHRGRLAWYTPSMAARIVIVDDEPRMAAVVAMALGRDGHECEQCGSAAGALQAVEARGADVVVTDLRMPDMDGLELLRRLHTDRPELPVILLTAHASVPSAVAAKAAEAPTP